MTRRFLALGDSYTIGEGVDAADRWPSQLVRALTGVGAAVAEPEIIASTGWTSDELLQAIEARAPRPHFDLVTLLIGVNDQYRGRSTEEYRLHLRPLLALSVQLAAGEPGRVLMVSIPDWSVTPFAAADARGRETIAREIDRFNAVGRTEAHVVGARWANVTGISRAASATPSLLASDGLHPSRAMYAAWTEVLLPPATAILAR